MLCVYLQIHMVYDYIAIYMYVYHIYAYAFLNVEN